MSVVSVKSNSARDKEELMDHECGLDTNNDYCSVFRIPLEKNLKQRLMFHLSGMV